MRKFLIALLWMTTFRAVAQEISTKYLKEEAFEGVIFPKEYKALHANAQRFTPTKEEIAFVELAIKNQLPLLVGTQRHTPDIYTNLPRYRRQYFGYVDNKGNKIIYVNCFWGEKNMPNWRKSEVTVDDGGSYYWQVKVNLATRKLFALNINGSA